jgi:glycosyltransferase involved in cell wall biosynthesis
MLCSIIIPLYNKASFVTTAIESVLSQSYQDFEIIVVDDGSTDDGASIVKAIPDHRIQLIQQVNNGVSYARNQGIELAKGELICFLDADDWYLSSYLETVVSMASRHPDIAFFATNYKCISTSSLNTASFSWDPGNTQSVEIIDDLFSRWGNRPLFVINSVAVRHKHLIQFKPCFPPGEQWAEDQDLWFRIAEKSLLAYCSMPLVGYRKDVDESLCSIYELECILPPTFVRLEQRAVDRQPPDRVRNSALRLVDQCKITLARRLVMNGRRYDAFIELLNARREMISRRWWVSLMMCLLASPVFISRWENWRIQRARDW